LEIKTRSRLQERSKNWIVFSIWASTASSS
jgi:hypothetical protein